MTQLFLAFATLLSVPQATPQDPKSEISDPEAIDFCRKIEKGLLEGKPEAFNDVLDTVRLVDTALRGLELTAAELTPYRAWVSKGFSMGKILVPASGNSYRFLGYRVVGPNRGALFRMWGDEGTNYHLFKLARSPAGEIRITDAFVFLTGDWISSFFRRGALAIIAREPERLAKLERVDAVVAEIVGEWRQLQALAAQGTKALVLRTAAERTRKTGSFKVKLKLATGGRRVLEGRRNRAFRRCRQGPDRLGRVHHPQGFADPEVHR